MQILSEQKKLIHKYLRWICKKKYNQQIGFLEQKVCAAEFVDFNMAFYFTYTRVGVEEDSEEIDENVSLGKLDEWVTSLLFCRRVRRFHMTKGRATILYLNGPSLIKSNYYLLYFLPCFLMFALIRFLIPLFTHHGRPLQEFCPNCCTGILSFCDKCKPNHQRVSPCNQHFFC